MGSGIDGKLDGAFQPVADALVEGFERGRDTGAAVGVVLDGRVLVDIWHGHADRQRQRPWQSDTLVCQFSVTKAMTTLCVLQAVDRGLLKLDEPVVASWPEFAAHDKHEITLRHLLCHRAGLIGFHEPMPAELFEDWQHTTNALAAERPWWPPGSRHGYHARTFGFLAGEVFRRRTGRSIGTWFREEIASPNGIDFHIGVAERDLVRCADIVPARIRAGEQPPSSAARLMKAMGDRDSFTWAAFQNPATRPGRVNSAEHRRSEMPGANGHGTALASAMVLDRFASLVSAELLAEATTSHSSGDDPVLVSPTRFGLGLMLHDDACPIGLRTGSYGHAGAGGAVVFHDPEQRLSLCFAMNQLEPGVITGGSSASLVTKAVYECL